MVDPPSQVDMSTEQQRLPPDRCGGHCDGNGKRTARRQPPPGAHERSHRSGVSDRLQGPRHHGRDASANWPPRDEAVGKRSAACLTSSPLVEAGPGPVFTGEHSTAAALHCAPKRSMRADASQPALFGAAAPTALRICAQCNGDARPHVGRVNHVIHACRDTRLSHERASSTSAPAPHSRLLDDCGRTGVRPDSVQVPGGTLSSRLPT